MIGSNSFLGCLAAVALVASLVLPAQANERLAGIKGLDDRILVESKEYPWRAIARFNHQGSFCTATLIGPALALTAAHCMFDSPAEGWKKPENIHLLFGYHQGEWVIEGKVKDYTVPKDYVPQPLATPGRYRSGPDWAVLELTEAIGNVTGWMGISALNNSGLSALASKGQALAQAGYSRDKSHRLTVNLPCALPSIDHARKTIRHTCDTVGGDSGSPIFTWQPDGFRIVGIHVATARTPTRTWGIAVPSVNYAEAVAAKNPPNPQPPAVEAPSGEKTARQLLKRMGEDVSDLSMAIKRHQMRNGLDATGQPSVALLGRLINAQKWVEPKSNLPTYDSLQELLNSTRVGRGTTLSTKPPIPPSE
ncbi:MAG: trypsin-like serine peptidase [Magnetovibrionaceae bacterium]